MTFKETDFPELIKYLKSVAMEEQNPFILRQIVLQLVNLYEEIPLYPGIVNMCIGKAMQTIPASEVTIGQKIYIKNRDDYYVGMVAFKDDDGIKLRNVHQITSDDELDLEYKDMESVSVIDEKVLEKLWPSLVFHKAKGK